MQQIQLYFDDYFARQVKRLTKKEPQLWQLIQQAVDEELAQAKAPLVPGLGGWMKCRLPAPTLGIGRSGGYRLIFLFMRTRDGAHLGALYFKREQGDLSA